MKKIQIVFILLFTTLSVFSQEVAISKNKKYIATCFYNIRDSLEVLKVNSKPEKVFYYKYKLNVYRYNTKEIVQSFESVEEKSLNKNLNFKVLFSKNDEYIFVFSGNKKLNILNTEYGFVKELDVKNVALSKDNSQLFLLQKNGISIFDTETLKLIRYMKYKAKPFKSMAVSEDNKIIIFEKYKNGKKYFSFVDAENAKNRKNVKGNTFHYNSNKQEIMVFKNGNLLKFKTPKFKEKNLDLKSKYNSKKYKKYFNLTSIQPKHKYISLISDKKITLLNTSGKKFVDIEKPIDFISCTWKDDEHLIIETKENIETCSINDLSMKEFCILRRTEMPTKSNLFFNTDTSFTIIQNKNNVEINDIKNNKHFFIDNGRFMDFSADGKTLFLQESQYQIAYYDLNNITESKKKHLLICKPINNLSPLKTSYYLPKREKSYVNEKAGIIVNPQYNTEVLEVQYSFYEKKTKRKDKNGLEIEETVTDTIISTELSFYNTFAVVDTKKGEVKKISGNKISKKELIYLNRRDYVKNKSLQKIYKDSLAKAYYEKTVNWNTPHDLRVTNNKSLIIRNKINTNDQVQIINLNNFEIGKSIKYRKIVFSPNNSYFAVANYKSEVILYNSDTGDEILKYKIKPIDIFLTESDKFMIVRNSKDYHFITSKKTTKLGAFYVEISKDGKTLFTISKDKLHSKTYSLPKLELLETNNLPESLKMLLVLGKIQTSPDFKFISCYTANKKLRIIELGEESKVFTIGNVESIRNSYWLDNENVIISKESGPEVFNVKDKHYNLENNYKFYFPDNQRYVNPAHLYSGNISPSGNLAVLDFKRKGKKIMYFKNTKNKYNHYFIPNSEFIGFSENEDKIFFKKGENRLGYVETKEVLGNMSSDKLKIKEFKIPLRATRVLPPIPKIISYDSDPPPGYHYERIKNYKHISTAMGDSTLGIYTHNVETDGNDITVNMHIIDKKGNYYYGASEDKYKDIWCEVWLKDKNGKTVQIKDFTVDEVTKKDAEKLSLALVLDQSGSMGKNRCYAIQIGAKNFITSKRAKDGVSIVKFDHNVKVEVNYNVSENFLLTKLKLNGYGRFGGSTAMYDGIYSAINELVKTKTENKKAVIVMTDGYENSSYTYLNQLILYAVENNVSIYTIGFGEWVNVPVLQTIAYQTNGGYYDIYKTKNMKWIFEDIYNKTTNHYSLKFKTPKLGKYAVIVKPCNKLLKNTTVMAFDNRRINYNNIREVGEDGFGVPIYDLSDSITYTDFITQTPIGSLENIVNTEGSNFDWFNQTEFESIEFPDIKFFTDKTIIVKGTDKGLDKVITYLKKHKDIIIEISGHTDEVGTGSNNLDLSKRRANKVKSLIVKKGVAPSRIITAGYGETKPIASNKTEKGRLKNRRVEFKIIK